MHMMEPAWPTQEMAQGLRPVLLALIEGQADLTISSHLLWFENLTELVRAPSTLEDSIQISQGLALRSTSGYSNGI